MIQKQCKCCKEFWYDDPANIDICPSCYEFILRSEILNLKRLKNHIRRERKNKIGLVLFEKDIIKIINKFIKENNKKLGE